MATFGRYDILDKIGEGAMGVVYRARDGNLGRIVALKMLAADAGGEDELHQRFHREAEAIGRLSHPNIVTVYDLGETDGQLYMAMELLEGDDLRFLIDQQIEIPLAEKLRILIDICEGLGYAHSRGVIHRDIKPANILVTAAGRVKLLDFGLARVATRATITRQGVILGTPDYMAPEQAMGRPIDHRSDIFSAGSVFYEFLSLEKPFKGKTLHSVLYQIIQEQPDNLLTLNPELPTRLAALVHGMMRKEPEERFSSLVDVGRSMAELYVALRRSKGRSALPQPGAPSTEETRTRVREHVTRARQHLDGGRPAKAMGELAEALALDPASDEASELMWRSQARRSRARETARDPAVDQRIQALLLRAAPGSADAEARGALAELALIAPDDPRFGELLRARAGRDREPPPR